MAKAQKKLALLSGTEIDDPEAHSRFYAALTGVPVTAESVKKFRRLIAAEKADGKNRTGPPG